MPTPAERSALLFVAAVAAFGLAVRGCRALRPPPVPPDDRAALAAQLAAVDSVIAAGGRARATRPAGDRAARRPAAAAPAAPLAGSAAPAAAPPGPGEPVDVDRASAEELDELPGIGPTLAARIVADRAQHGPFGSLEGLQRVKGIGPALAGRLGPRVTFSGLVRPPRAVGPARGHPYP